MAIKFSQLAIFCALVEEGTIYAAAEKMYCVPSNITSRIKDLEYTLKVALFNREPRKLTITPEGRAFYVQAKKLLEHSQQCQSLFQQTPYVGELNIGVLPAILKQPIHAKILQFLKENSQVNLHLYTGSALFLFEQLLAAELDLIFIDGIIQHPKISTQLLRTETLYLICNQHDFATFQQVAAQHILFCCHHASIYHLRLQDWLSQQQIYYQRQCNVDSYHFALDAVQQQIGFTILPGVYLDEVQQRSLHALQLPHLLGSELAMAWRRGHSSQLLQLFIQLF